VPALTPAQLVDLAAIQEAALRYSHGIDRLDGDVMRSAYWPDATDDHGVFVGNAWDFVDRCLAGHGRWRSTLHCVLNHWVEFEGETAARGEVYNLTYLFPHQGEPSLWVGRYLDAYQRRDGEWRILHRVCVHEGTTMLSATPMAIAAERFRSGDADRRAAGGAS
jgi:SnoaL-like domain